MKYCLPYNKYTFDKEFVNEADEWTIDYNPDDVTLFKFLDVYKDKRINFRIGDKIDIKEEVGIGFIKEITNKYPNLYILIQQYSPEIKEILQNNEIKNYFFSTYVSNIDLFYILVNSGASDIYIVESLGFDLDKISKVAKEKNVAIRIFPNVAQAISDEIPNLKRFFIRPEDIQDYEEYVDVCEFFYEDETCLNYLNIYKNMKEWYGDLSEIINGLNVNLDSRYILPRFGEVRAKCGKKCFKGEPCHICELIQESSGLLEEAGLVIEKEKK